MDAVELNPEYRDDVEVFDVEVVAVKQLKQTKNVEILDIVKNVNIFCELK